MEDKEVQKKLFVEEITTPASKKNFGVADNSNDENTDKPQLESTTLWDFPKQSYGKTPKGNNKFQGVTPAFIIYNMIMRYTKEGDTVLDPMCGSGTTIDVCKEERRKVIGFDIHPTRPDIIKNDSRRIPLENDSVDMVFIDSPYGDNVNYSDDPENMGKIAAESVEFYLELEKVARELFRVLKPGKVLGWLIGDQWVKRRFTPVGFKTYQMLTEKVGFQPIDIICVARRNQSSNTKVWHYRALKWNFYLRGFKYLFIVKKPDNQFDNISSNNSGSVEKITWQKYK